MNCDDIRKLLPAHLDGELDVVRDAEVVAHLDHCPACADLALAHAARRGLVQEKLPRHAAPPDLRASIVASLKNERRPESPKVIRLVFRQVLPLAAGLAIAATIGFEWGVRRTHRDVAVGEFVSAYVRAATTGHTMDVASSDQHTVKPWFRGRLDFSPTVPDLAADGFPLVGGRLDRIGDKPAAVLVYQRRKHVIDVFVSPAGAAAVPADTHRVGFNLLRWTQADQQYVAVSDLAASELADFARLFQAAAH
ncbi:MAG TPA: anti-sigma factor [Opitutus sp.]|nr:anti-sigma factor [Opitutus sp.]